MGNALPIRAGSWPSGAVDALHAERVAAGYTSLREPWSAERGVRYATGVNCADAGPPHARVSIYVHRVDRGTP